MADRDHKPFDSDAVDGIARAIIPDAAIMAEITDGRLRIEAGHDAAPIACCPVDALNALLEPDGEGAQVGCYLVGDVSGVVPADLVERIVDYQSVASGMIAFVVTNES